MYMIGEVLNKFMKDSLAYCKQGVLEGTFIMCNQEEQNRLFYLRPNGECEYDFYFAIDNEIEDKEQWVFVNEIKDLELAKKANETLTNSIVESLKKGYQFKIV